MENPFKIQKGVALKSKFDPTMLSFLIESLKELKSNSAECVYVPNEVLPSHQVYRYVSRATILLRHQVGPVKFTIRSIKEDKEVVGTRIFRLT